MAEEKLTRLSFRVGPELKDMIAKAAAAAGQSIADYCTSHLAASARRDLQQLTVLSDRDREVFLAMLNDEAEPNEALRRAAGRRKERPTQ